MIRADSSPPSVFLSVQMNFTSAAEFYGYSRFYKLVEVNQKHSGMNSSSCPLLQLHLPPPFNLPPGAQPPALFLSLLLYLLHLLLILYNYIPDANFFFYHTCFVCLEQTTILTTTKGDIQIPLQLCIIVFINLLSEAFTGQRGLMGLCKNSKPLLNTLYMRYIFCHVASCCVVSPQHTSDLHSHRLVRQEATSIYRGRQ